MTNMNKHKKIVKLIISILLGTIIALISFNIIAFLKLPECKVYPGNMNDVDTGNSELIVSFHETPNEEDLHTLFDVYKDSIKVEKHLEEFVLISISDSEIYPDIINYLDNHSQIKSVEPNGSIQLMQNTNDTYSFSQWPIYNPGYYSLYTANGMKEVASKADIDMDVPEAWMLMNQETATRREVIVAIIDTGIDYTHPDLAEHIWVNSNEIPGDGIDNDMNGYVDDMYGWDFYNDDASVSHFKYNSDSNLNLYLPEDNDDHGTHIAGIIGAVADNGFGIAGIASNIDVKLMVLKINGGIEGTGSISDAILAIKYATRMGADICNISWGTTQYSSTLKEVINESNMLFVAAAGNLGRDNDSKPVYPSSFKLDNLISVTFIDAYGKLTRLSNYGQNSVEIAAPGMDIMSTVVGSYQTLGGSSMAAPHVSAVASLLYSYDKSLYPLAVKDIIIKTLKPIPELKNTILYPGIPNAYLAVQEINNVQQDLVPPIINIETVYEKDSIMIPVKVEDEGGSGVRVTRWLAGRRELIDFNLGTSGHSIDNSQINISKAGAYTIYASDYARNETVQIYEIEDDTTPPRISSGYSVSEDYKTRNVNIKVIDTKSGIKRVKYLLGNKQASDFLPIGSGNELELVAGKSSFSVDKDGVYTLYAIDNRGNQSIKQIEVKTVLSEEIKFVRRSKTITVGEVYYLRAFVKPFGTTDTITYTSSDDGVASINSKGKITAHKVGTANITARTNNGYRAVCKIVVIKQGP